MELFLTAAFILFIWETNIRLDCCYIYSYMYIFTFLNTLHIAYINVTAHERVKTEKKYVECVITATPTHTTLTC